MLAIELFPREQIVGIFRGFHEGGLEFHADQDLQALHLRADRRLGHAEALSGFGEAAKIHDCDQRSQQLGRNIGHAARRRLRCGPAQGPHP